MAVNNASVRTCRVIDTVTEVLYVRVEKIIGLGGDKKDRLCLNQKRTKVEGFDYVLVLLEHLYLISFKKDDDLLRTSTYAFVHAGKENWIGSKENIHLCQHKRIAA